MQVRFHPVLLGVLAILTSCVASAQGPVPKTAEKSVTLYPVVLTTSRSIPASLPERLAEVVGTFLERAGMDEVEIAKKPFPIPENGDLKAVSNAFGKFVRDNPPKTGYAVLGQVVADGQSINEIRTVVVDKGGKVVFSECADQRVANKMPAGNCFGSIPASTPVRSRGLGGGDAVAVPAAIACRIVVRRLAPFCIYFRDYGQRQCERQ